MANVVASPQFTLKWRDFLRGLIIAVLTSVLVVVQQTIESGVLTFDWNSIGIAAVGSGVAYVLKNYLEPSKVITVVGKESTTKETAETIKEAV